MTSQFKWAALTNERRIILNYFRSWKHRIAYRYLATHFSTRDLKEKCFMYWSYYARKLQNIPLNIYQHRLLQNAYSLWLSRRLRSLRIGQECVRRNIHFVLTFRFSKWKSNALDQKEYTAYHYSNIKVKAFTWWREILNHHRSLLLRADHYYRTFAFLSFFRQIRGKQNTLLTVDKFFDRNYQIRYFHMWIVKLSAKRALFRHLMNLHQQVKIAFALKKKRFFYGTLFLVLVNFLSPK